MTHRLPVVLAALVICALPLVLRAQDHAHGAGVERFDPARDADADIRAAVAEAGKTGKRVLLDVGGEWCIWCRRLDTLFTTHDELRTYRDAHYVVVKVNWSPENKNERVLSRYPKVAGYPHLFVLDGGGTLLRSQDTGALEKGKGHDPDKVMAFLKQWARAE
ncbi:MAG TPA: thioredoxin family protein [Bacteroidota bacterium]|nr:thioredoxin family protein [Bacteroidota bacterium]